MSQYSFESSQLGPNLSRNGFAKGVLNKQCGTKFLGQSSVVLKSGSLFLHRHIGRSAMQNNSCRLLVADYPRLTRTLPLSHIFVQCHMVFPTFHEHALMIGASAQRVL